MSTYQRKALIFGVTGQDGSYLADFLLRKGYIVHGVKRRSSVDSLERVRAIEAAEFDENFTLHEGDVTDALCVFNLLNSLEPDEIYNLAAQSHVKTSFAEPKHTWDVVAGGPLNILESIRLLWDTENILGPSFYQASSSEMFGSCWSASYRSTAPDTFFDEIPYHGEGEPPRGAYQCEHTPMKPNSPYAIAKLAAHNAVRLYREAYGVRASSGILFNHESERRGENFVTRKITKWIAQYAVCKDTSNFDEINDLKLGNLSACRDWGHAMDYVRGMWMMLQRNEPDDYVLATGRTRTVSEFLTTAIKCIGGEDGFIRSLITTDMDLFRPSEVPYLNGFAGKARKVLGWKPEISFEDLVYRMVCHDIDKLYGKIPSFVRHPNAKAS